MSNSHIHTPDDGRGPRRVLLNGVPQFRVVYANLKKGKIRVLGDPVKLDKYRKRAIERTLHGVVAVEPLCDSP